ncbi:hypothetical protein KC356_g326 [Hortaea werneckii]|nr:hypothetical protein KC356_g326 [Hortaea werneckii]
MGVCPLVVVVVYGRRNAAALIRSSVLSFFSLHLSRGCVSYFHCLFWVEMGLVVPRSLEGAGDDVGEAEMLSVLALLDGASRLFLLASPLASRRVHRATRTPVGGQTRLCLDLRARTGLISLFAVCRKMSWSYSLSLVQSG